MTPLSCASDNGHSEVVRVLIQAGADVNTQDKVCQTSLCTVTIVVSLCSGDSLHSGWRVSMVTQNVFNCYLMLEPMLMCLKR